MKGIGISERNRNPTTMKTIPFLRLIAAAGLLVAGPSVAFAGNFHFRPDPVPADEARLMELARIREFRGSYELGEFAQGTLLIAELHVEGQPVKAFRLSRAKYDRAKQTRSGTLSFGWHRDARHLVSVNDNGDLYSPWTAKIDLPDFSPQDAHWFADSVPERRKAKQDWHASFELYPVMGLCGERISQVNYSNIKTGGDFVNACTAAGAKSAVMIYLYKSTHDEEPSIKFEAAPKAGEPATP
jgi:hypothetical protein